MEEFGKSRKKYSAKFLELSNGIPDRDTFRRVFEKLNPSELSSCLINWVTAGSAEHSVVAIGGKDHSPLNLNVLRKIALNLVSQAQYGRMSKKRMMFKAALEPELFLKILFAPQK